MRITDQILAVVDYGGETEEVVACYDGMKEAREHASFFLESGPVTLCRVKIIEVVETLNP